MEYPQPNIPHRTADGSAGHVARRTEVKAPEPTSRSEFRTVLRSKTMNSRPRHSLGASSSSSRNATSVLLNASCRTCGTTLSDELPMTKKWASSSDIFKAYSDPSTSLSVRRSGPVRTSSVKNFQRISKPGEISRIFNYKNSNNFDQDFNRDFQITSRLAKTMIWFASIYLARRLAHLGKFENFAITVFYRPK